MPDDDPSQPLISKTTDAAAAAEAEAAAKNPADDTSKTEAPAADIESSNTKAPSDDPLAVDDEGIPLKSSYGDLNPISAYPVIHTIQLGIGLGIAYLTYAYGSTSKYDATIAVLHKYDLGWLYLSAVVLRMFISLHSILLGSARKEAKVNVPDQHVYKVHQNGERTLGYVLMEPDGVLGRFNRAQRQMVQYTDLLAPTLFNVALSGAVFPFPTFVAFILFSVVKFWGAYSYVSSTEARMGGVLLGFLLADVLVAFVLLAGIKAL